MKASFFTESVLYFLARGLSASLGRLPPSWGIALGSWSGTLAFHLAPRRRTVGLANLKTAFGGSYSPGEYRKILKEMFQHFGMTLMEVAMIPRIDRTYVDRWVQIAPGCEERLKAALAKGRGVIFITGHFGDWELISLTGALHGYPTLVLAREQGWPRLNALLTRYRESRGCRVVTKGFPIRALIQGLKEGRIIGILSDQDGGRNGVLAPFFGRLASTAPGAVALSVNTGAPVLPVFMVRRRGAAHTLYVEEPLEIPTEGPLEDRIQAGIAQYLNILEKMVRRYPAQWLWLHRRWKSSPQKRVLILSDGKAGHRSQAQALAERIEAAWKIRSRQDHRLQGFAPSLVRVEILEVAFRHPAGRLILRLIASIVPRRFSSGERWLRWALTPDSYRRLAAASADWSISCGSSMACVNLLWAWGVGAKPIHIHRSRWPSWSRFALALIPRHDLASLQPVPANVLPIDGAVAPIFKASDGRRKQWRELLGLSNGRPIGLLVGGPARGLDLEQADVEKTVEGVLAAAEGMNVPLLVTSSRRTPPAMEQWLHQKLSRHPLCRLLVLVNRRERGPLKDTAEAIPCLLEISHVLVVSGDSISMVSEALATAKPVVSFLGSRSAAGAGGSAATRLCAAAGTKYHRFLRQMRDQGRIRLASPEGMRETLEQVMQKGSGGRGQSCEGTPHVVECPPQGCPHGEGCRVQPDMDPMTEFLVRWL